jgi:hypothetical protein
MAVRALTVGGEVEYVSPRDPCYDENGKHKEGATRFRLRMLDGNMLAMLKDENANVDIQVTDGTVTQGGLKMAAYAAAMKTVRFAVCGWENYEDQSGNSIQFRSKKVFAAGKEREVVDEALMDGFDPDLALGIHRKVMSANAPSPAVAKN